MVEEFLTQNGNKKVKIIPASFKQALKLKQEALKCITDKNISKGLDLNSTKDGNTMLAKIVDIISAIDSSEAFNNAVFDCLSCCTYEEFHKITEQLFDDFPELREDYYEIVAKCVEVNLRPFFKSLSSELKTRFKSIDNALEQKLPQTERV